MKRIAKQVNEEGKEFGLEVVDVRIKRADLPEQNQKNVFDRMRAERQREAAEFRAEGTGAANRIRANADREVTIIKARGHPRGRADARRGRRRAQPHLRRRVQPRSRLLRLLSLDAGLRAGHQGRRYAHAAVARQRVLQVFQQPQRKCDWPAQTMSDILVAIGLVLVIEGLLWAAAPQLALRLLAAAAQMPEQAPAHGRGRGYCRRSCDRMAGAGLSEAMLIRSRRGDSCSDASQRLPPEAISL